MRAPCTVLLATAFAALAGACARGPVPPPRSVAASAGSPGAYPFAVTAPGEDRTVNEKPPVSFERDYEQVPSPDAEPSACSFNLSASESGSFGYEGMISIHGRPFARADALGAITSGSIGVEEGSLYAPGIFAADHASISGEVYLPDVRLYAAVPIVYDGWLHVLRTRIASKTSVKGPFFAPDVKLPPEIRLRTPLREDAMRVPCAFATASQPENDANAFARTTSWAYLHSPDKNVSISLTPTGAPVADIVKPSELGLHLVTLYKTTALVSVVASTKESEVMLVGWIHDGTLDDGGGGLGLGTMGTIGHPNGGAFFDCDDVSIFVEVDRKLFKVADVWDHKQLYGAPAPNGELRVDLGANPGWSAKAAPKKGAKEPLDPFVPKELLARCKEIKR